MYIPDVPLTHLSKSLLTTEVARYSTSNSIVQVTVPIRLVRDNSDKKKQWDNPQNMMMLGIPWN